MKASSISVNVINRQTLESYTLQPEFQQSNIKLNIFNFADVFDLSMQVPLDKRPKISSHSFIEFFIDVNGKPFQIAAGYLEDFVYSVNPESYTMQANGKTLIGQLMYSNFKKTLYSENMEMGSFINLALKGEYLEQYNKLKSRPGMIIDKNYNRASFLACSDQTQMKGQIIERYAKLGCLLVYQDRLGRIVLLGKDYPMPEAKGRLVWAKGRSNIENLVIRNSFSEVFSDATVFYTQSEAITDANATPSVRYVNTDPRVNGVVNRPYYETFSVSDIQHFAGNIGAATRMTQVAKSLIRVSNRKVNQVVITTDAPYFFDSATKDFIPYELMQVWEIESDQNDLTDFNNPNGVQVVKMVLTGIDYSGTDSEMNVQLQFTEFETLV